MVYLKLLLLGLGGAVLAAILWFLVAFILPLYRPYLIRRLRGDGGVSTACIGSGSIFIAALIGFLIAIIWGW